VAYAGVKNLCEEILKQLCQFFNITEEVGVMPPKGQDKYGADNLRPITVLSLVHSLWSGARLQATIFEWQEESLKGVNSKGCRPKASTKDLTVPLAIMLEVARYMEEEVHGSAYDLSKAFDTMPFDAEGEEVGWEMIKRSGLPNQIRCLLEDMYANLVRTFKWRGNLCEPISPEGLRGCVQGCALSMVLCNI